jgi:hypothetical protein
LTDCVCGDYLDLYSSLQQKLTAFDATVTSQWNGAKPPVDFCVQLRAPDADHVLEALGHHANLVTMNAK